MDKRNYFNKLRRKASSKRGFNDHDIRKITYIETGHETWQNGGNKNSVNGLTEIEHDLWFESEWSKRP